MSAGTMPIINIEQAKPAWMRAPTRSLSFAAMGLAAPTATPQPIGQQSSLGAPNDATQLGTSPADSIEYVDSDNWDIDDSDDDFARSERPVSSPKDSLERLSIDNASNHSPQGTIIRRPSNLDLPHNSPEPAADEAVLVDRNDPEEEPVVVVAGQQPEVGSQRTSVSSLQSDEGTTLSSPIHPP